MLKEILAIIVKMSMNKSRGTQEFGSFDVRIQS